MNLLLIDDGKLAVNSLIEGVDWDNAGIGEVFCTFCIEDAKKVIFDSNIDIVVCDVEIAGESGIEFLKWLGKNHPNIISIILTAHKRFEYVQQAISLKVHCYLLKPIQHKTFEEEIRICVKICLKMRLMERDKKFAENFQSQPKIAEE